MDIVSTNGPASAIEMKRICRVCMQHNNDMTCIFTENHYYLGSIDKKIVYCTGLEISITDGLPRLICNSCLSDLYVSCRFKTTCVKTDESLREITAKASHEIDLNEVDTHEVDSHEVDTHEVDTHEVDSHEVDTHEVDTHEVDKHEVGTHQIDSHEVVLDLNIDKDFTSGSPICGGVSNGQVIESKVHDEEMDASKVDIRGSVKRRSRFKDQQRCNKCYLDFNTREQPCSHRQEKHRSIIDNTDDDTTLAAKTEQTDIATNDLACSHRQEKHRTIIDNTDDNTMLAAKTEQTDIATNDLLLKHKMGIHFTASHVTNINVKSIKQLNNSESPLKRPLDDIKIRDNDHDVGDEIKGDKSGIKAPSNYAEMEEIGDSVRHVDRTKFIGIGEIGDFQCDECTKSFITPSRLNSHKAKSHRRRLRVKNADGVPENRTPRCGKCDKNFRTRSELLSHKHMVHKIRYICEVCGIETSNTNLKQHMLGHYPPKFWCNDCEYRTSNKADLRKHLRVHQDNTKTFACTQCSYRTRFTSNLHKHVRVRHEHEKAFPCHVCKFASACKRSLQRHLDAHNAIKRFSCDYCGSPISSRNSYTKHLLRQHGVRLKRMRPGPKSKYSIILPDNSGR